jgi:NitT/TauT family transport system permease protein
MSKRLLQWGTSILGVFIFLLIWQVGVMVFNVPAYFLPSPTRILEEAIKEYPKLVDHGWITVYEMLAGYGLAVVIGVPLAIAITSSRRFDELVTPTMLFFQVVPKIAVAPLFIVLVWSRHHAQGVGGILDFILSNRD